MGPRRMSRSGSWITVPQAVVAVLVLISFGGAGTGAAPNYNKVFVIGDSYQDNGNRDPANNTRTVIGDVNQPWKAPYGRTAGSPQGRFTDGAKCLSDYLADSLGLKPRPYRVLGNDSHPTRVSDGVNFAVGGAGVFDNQGFTKTGDQIRQLWEVIDRGVGGPYDSRALRASVVFYGFAGNDYAAFLRANANQPLQVVLLRVATFMKKVIEQATKDVLELYKLGFRSFVVGLLPPLGCIPQSAYNVSTDMYTCNEAFNYLALTHNIELSASLNASLPCDAKLIFLNNQAAFGTVTYKLTDPQRLVPCCTGLKSGRLCGDVDASGKPEYTLCEKCEQEKFFFWDEFHPTSAGWKDIFDLYLDNPFFSNGKSLKEFLGV